MYVSLTPGVAKDLGRTLRFLRHGRGETLADVAKRGEISLGYAQNIELGVRANATEESYEKLRRGYQVPEEVMRDLLLRARILTALERAGVAADDASFVWRGVEQRLEERGRAVKTDLAKIIAEMLPN